MGTNEQTHRKNQIQILIECCTSCTFEFQNKIQLETHSKPHSEEQFNCFKCSIQFNLKEELKSHIVTHSGNNYICEECGNMFQREEELNIHAR